MDLRKTLHRLAVRLANDDEDLRHTVLDVCDDLLKVFADESRFPERLRGEVRELREEAEAVQPRFRSHRNTSVLFDREGLGQAGRTRARNFAHRIVAVAKSDEREAT